MTCFYTSVPSLVLIAEAVFLLERGQTDEQTDRQTDATDRPTNTGVDNMFTYIGPPYCRTKMYAGRVACCPES